ncbi:hypothetical protein ACEWY4_017706 [Coilia grayii]|uniref:Transcription elongation factor 1 homolog n=1 Tax=Coilia grayii TaxID=363190 RepID=A0ABD1JHL1_9TELE
MAGTRQRKADKRRPQRSMTLTDVDKIGLLATARQRFAALQDKQIVMGRRKSKRKPPPKKKLTGDLDTQFTCPFCNHEKSCDVKMERSRNTGIISCSVCLEEFQTPITYLSEPVDVYSDWIDACETANQ